MSEEEVPDRSEFNRLLGGLEDSDDRENFGLRVGELLYGAHMHHYIDIFRDSNIGMDLFLSLNEDDLAVLGVSDNDIPNLARLIKCITPKIDPRDMNNHVQSEPEPKMSMKNVLLMQCYTAKQLKHINQLLKIIELKLKENQVNNTLLDSDYCAAQALKMMCSELARQADILSVESKNLNEALLKYTTPNTKENKPHLSSYVWIGILASMAPIAVVLWRSLRK